MSVTKDDLIQKIESLSKNGRISCKQALDLSVELGVTPRQVGEACNEQNIRISACQLGCFD